MKCKVTILEVRINQDIVPGWGHQPEDHIRLIKESVPEYYYPVVKLIGEETGDYGKENPEVSSSIGTCCGDMKFAVKKGSLEIEDNLMFTREGLQTVNFCPFCGKRVR